MSQGLIAHNGALLSVNGSLTNDPNCCCYYYGPSDCPPCCVRIDFGTFNDDGDLVGEFIADSFTIAVTIIMPTKNSRVVCDEELIEVQWGVIDDGIDSVGGFIRFGAGWSPGNFTPALPPEGIKLDYGLIDWGTGLIESQYTTQLTFRKCFLDSSTFLFYIDIGLTSPDFLGEIEITRCVSLTRCCPMNTTCENCCAVLTPGDTIAYNGKYYIVSENLDIDGTRKTTVAEINLEDGIVCIGDFVEIKLFLVPSRYDPLAMANAQEATHTTWERIAASPPINPVDGVTGIDFIDWGTLDEYEYSITVKAPDCTQCDEVTERFDDIVFTNSVFPALTVDFTKCTQEDCCCPVICSCEQSTHEDSLRCFWPIDYECTEESELDLWEVGGATQVINFETTANFDGPIITYVQNGLSEHRFSCYLNGGKWCPRSEYEIKVPVLETSGGVTTQKYIHILLSNEGDDDDPCNYRLRMDGIEYPYWVWEDQVSDCTMGSYAGNPLGIPGYFFETDFEITVSVECSCEDE